MKKNKKKKEQLVANVLLRLEYDRNKEERCPPGFDGLTHLFLACLMVHFAPLGILNISNRIYNVFADTDSDNNAHHHTKSLFFWRNNL